MSAGLQYAIDRERAARRRRKAQGRPYHYWQERGDDEAPRDEYWCKYCSGYFGVPHSHHEPGSYCRSMGVRPGNRQCACIDCVVWANEYALKEAKKARL